MSDREAFLILEFDVSKQMPIFIGAGIYSESCNTLTTDLSGDTCLINGPSATGKDYNEAREELISILKDHTFYNKWIFKYIEV